MWQTIRVTSASRSIGVMRGYTDSSYGDGFADVYDDWYADVTDVAATVALVTSLASESADSGAVPRVLELGVGTGRLAIPLAEAGVEVIGVDTSDEMLAVFEQRRAAASPEAADRSQAQRGDMAVDLPEGPFDVVLVAYNTLFNLLDADVQRACFAAVAERLAPAGRFVVEAIVPDPEAPSGTSVNVRSMAADRVVLSISDHRPDEQRTEGQFVELTESGGVRLRPWAIRWCAPAELDDMAAAAGLSLVSRTTDMAGAAWDDSADTHVSVYVRTTS